MKSLRLKSGDVRLLVIVTLVAVIAAALSVLLAPDEQKGSLWRQPSSFFTASYGTKALYLSMHEVGFDVRRLRRSLAPERLWQYQGLVIAEPQQPVMEHELDALRQWIRSGGTLVLIEGEYDTGVMNLFAPEQDPILNPDGDLPTHVWRYGRDDEADARIRDEPNEDEQAVATGDAASPGNGDVSTDVDAGSDGPHELMQGVRRLEFGESEERLAWLLTLSLPRTFGRPEVVYADPLGPAVVQVTAGRGQVVVLASSYPLSNAGIAEADNAVFAANIAAALGGGVPVADEPGDAADEAGGAVLDAQAPRMFEPAGAVAFDEFHLGFPQRDAKATAIVKLIATGPYGWAVMQVIAVGVLALWAGAVRFGRPHDIPPIRRRNRSAFARAAGGLMRSAGAGALTLETLYDYHRQAWCRAVSLPARADDAALAEAVHRRSEIDVGPIFQEVTRVRKAGAISDSQLLDLAGKMHRVTEVLEHGA